MPKTKFQEAVFSVMMAAVMVYAMELYNLAINAGGLSNQMFLRVFKDLALMGIMVIALEKLIAGPLARKLAFRIVTPEVDKPIFIILAISAFTVCVMCPMMSFVATLIFKHAGNQVVAIWLQTTVKNFPMALFWQIFFAGPLVRCAFRHMFARQLAQSHENVCDSNVVSENEVTKMI